MFYFSILRIAFDDEHLSSSGDKFTISDTEYIQFNSIGIQLCRESVIVQQYSLIEYWFQCTLFSV